jgi:putative ABC transport system substrate-binding protein
VRRAAFLRAGIAGLLLGSAGARAADSSRTYRIYMVLWRGSTDVEQGFQAYLNERGIRHELIVRDLNTDRSKLPGFVDEIRRLRPDLVYTWGTTSTLGIVGPSDVRDPTRYITDIPVVFTLVAYPLAAKLVAEDNAPGANVTGVRFLAPIDSQLAAIQNYRALHSLAVVYNPAEQNSLINVAELRERAKAGQFRLVEKPAPLDGSGNPMGDAVPQLVREAKAEGAEWLYIGPDSFTAVHADALTGTAVQEGLPSFAATELPLKNSQAMSGLVSPYYALGKLTASQAEKILVAGQSPGTLPVAQLSRFSLVLNLPVIKRLGFYPPMRVLGIADIIR